ncbi:type VI secretion protein ImpA [Pseudomonas syringae]|uniref:Type VI secretion protein ImpA n=1 Tax=Pseudomonas syringae TaxID=317 RepID=A0A1C7Z2H3_PSESX|nr:type VI secretion system protein TssA [Pseudomonas syringae]OCR24234.1 type VI secretion protein ImpA [Pseudomonas syringae]
MSPTNATARYLKIAQTPISKGDYAGLDARYSPEYEALEVELAKALSLHENGKVDWQKVQEHSEVILTTLSKDLRVVCWLSWALYQLQSFAGLVAGFGMLCHFCTHHWAQIHPAKSRTRSAAISWLIMRLEKALDSNVPVKDQLELFRQLVKLLEELDAVLTQHLKADAPLILPLRRRLASMVQRASDHRPEPGPMEAAIAQVKQTATQWFAGESVIENEKDAQKALRGQQENGLALCAWWLRQKATDPRALRLNRTLTWLSITSVPQQNAERITDLRAPPPDKLKSYRSLFEQGQYADLLVQLEASIARAPFWLDGQRMVWECLDALDAEVAKQELEIHCALFVQRLPGIVELRFHDGVEFANVETRDWITAHVMPRVQPIAAPRKVEEAGIAPAWQLALEKTVPMLRKGGLKAAVQEMKQGLQSAQGGRERFFWQFSLARLCHRAKKYDLARAQLETLDQQLQQSGLHLWEPDLALEVLRLLHGCYGLLPQGHEVRERKDEIYRRLCHLDLEVVLE